MKRGTERELCKRNASGHELLWSYSTILKYISPISHLDHHPASRCTEAAATFDARSIAGVTIDSQAIASRMVCHSRVYVHAVFQERPLIQILGGGLGSLGKPRIGQV